MLHLYTSWYTLLQEYLVYKCMYFNRTAILLYVSIQQLFEYSDIVLHFFYYKYKKLLKVNT